MPPQSPPQKMSIALTSSLRKQLQTFAEQEGVSAEEVLFEAAREFMDDRPIACAKGHKSQKRPPQYTMRIKIEVEPQFKTRLRQLRLGLAYENINQLMAAALVCHIEEWNAFYVSSGEI